MQGIVQALAFLARRGPTIVWLDDLHWADGASLNLLFRLGRRIGDSRILIVGTLRPDEVALGSYSLVLLLRWCCAVNRWNKP